MAAGTVVRDPHPLLQPETLARTLTGIATEAAPTAIVELIRWLDSLQSDGDLPAGELARLVVALDDAAQPQLRQAGGLYLSNVFGCRSLRYKALGRDCYSRLGLAYGRALGAGALADGLQAEIRWRVVRAAAGEMKWAAFDYQELAPEVWWRAVAAYRAAQGAEEGCAPLAVGDGQHARAMVSREFMQLVAMRCASLDQLSPDRIEAADKVIRHLGQVLDLSAEARDGSRFAVDLEGLAAPRRCLTIPLQASASMRYFRPADAVPMLGELGKTLERGCSLGPVFAGLAAPVVGGAIRHLSRHWGEVPPMRQYRRHRVRGGLALATGLGFIRSLISGDAQLRPAAAWSLQDASRNGFGIVADTLDPDVCRVGTLVGAHVGDTGRWVLALVRRVRAGDEGRAVVGLQTVSSDPRPVELDDGARSSMGILCDPVMRGRVSRIACEPGVLRAPRPFFARCGGRTVRLISRQVVLSGPGYQIVACDAL